MKRLKAALIIITLSGINAIWAATVTVRNTADSGVGTLREALAVAADGDTINFSATGTISLTSGELFVNKSVAISGPGLANLVVDGNDASRVFHISAGKEVTIANLTITNGHVAGDTGEGYPEYGGGILNEGSLTLSMCAIYGNSVGPGGLGGGIFNNSILHIFNSRLSYNSVGPGGGGGAIFNGYSADAAIQLVNCTLNSNRVGGGGAGGAIHNFNGGLIIVSSTMAENAAGTAGGGIFNRNGEIRIENSTVSANSAPQGGAIYNYAGGLQIANATFNGNLASFGGGIFNIFKEARIEIGNTILNAGASGENLVNYFQWPGTVTSLGFNLSSDDGGGLLIGPGDQINTDPLLGPLQDNGGPTFTHALLCGSPAIDHGKNLAGSTTDQRGFARTFISAANGSASGSDGTDIGAFEDQHEGCGSPATEITNLIALLRELNLHHGVSNGLMAKLQAAERALSRRNPREVCDNLSDFICEVNGHKGKKLAPTETILLVSEATRIRAEVGCP